MDDNETWHEIIKNMLDMFSLDSKSVSSGHAAIEVFKRIKGEVRSYFDGLEYARA